MKWTKVLCYVDACGFNEGPGQMLARVENDDNILHSILAPPVLPTLLDNDHINALLQTQSDEFINWPTIDNIPSCEYSTLIYQFAIRSLANTISL